MEQNFENDFSVLYENDSTSNYLVLRTGIEKSIINYQAQMLLNNKLNCLLEFNVNHIGDGINCFYNVTSKCTLTSFMSRKRFSRDEFLITILSIINNIYQLKNYLLYDSNILLDENFIYVEPESIEIYFVYLPFLNCDNDIKAFFIKLIFKLVKFHDEYSDNYIQKILEVIKNDNFSLGNLKSLIENLLGEEIKNESSKNWTNDSSNNAEEKEFGLRRNKVNNGLDINENSRLQKNEKSSLEKTKTSGFKRDKVEIDKVKSSKSKSDKQEINQAKTNELLEVKVKTGMFKADNATSDKANSNKANADKDVLARGNLRIPNPPGIKKQDLKNQEQKNLNLAKETEDSVSEHDNESSGQNKKMRLLLSAMLLLQPSLIINFIFIINSNFVKKSDNPMNTVVILIIIFLSVDVLVIRMINEKRKKTDETSSNIPLQFITDMMRSKTKHKDNDLLDYVNDIHEDQLPIVNENYNGETVIIKRSRPTEIPYLKEKDGEEVVEINKNSLLIGRMESFVDFVINSSTIGKIHAEILQDGEEFYIMDCNSKNGTFLNDNRIVPNTKNKVSNNDLLRFANKEFIFFSSSNPKHGSI